MNDYTEGKSWKQEKQRRILEAGFRLFTERGIEAVSMPEVAEASGVARATLYRYFETKLDLAIAIAVWQWKEYGEEAQRKRMARGIERMSAAERLDFYLGFYIDLYREHKELLIFNQSFNGFVQHEGAGPEQLAPFRAAVGGFGQMFHGLYEQGRRDGTIRTDLPEDKMFAATAHIMLAVAVRYAQGLLFSAEHEEDRTEEFELLKRALLREFVTGT